MQVSPPDTLPVPDDTSLEHSAKVAAHIAARIEHSGGSIGFAEFMQEALYAPGLGYYVAGARKFGVAGDFITAPESAPLFSRVLARQVAEVLQQLPVGSRAIVEAGGGSGALAVELLRKLRELDALPEQYLFLEVSPDLAARQAEAIESAIPDFADRVSWLATWPEKFSGVFIANEVLDALPVERFEKSLAGVLQERVAQSGSDFVRETAAANSSLRDAVLAIEQNLNRELAVGYQSEVCLAAPQWISELAGSLERGFAFLLDYGVSEREYYAEDRGEGWLRCYFRHRQHNDPFRLVGIQDLTAWVNFTQVAAAASNSGLSVAGYLPQSRWLLEGGLPEELANMGEMPTDAQIDLSRQVKVLTMPGEMGENIKCLGLSAGGIAGPGVFHRADRAHTL